MSLDALVEWWLSHVQEVADSKDAASRQLEGEFALLHAEYSIGDRDEESLRTALARCLGNRSRARTPAREATLSPT